MKNVYNQYHMNNSPPSDVTVAVGLSQAVELVGASVEVARKRTCELPKVRPNASLAAVAVYGVRA